MPQVQLTQQQVFAVYERTSSAAINQLLADGMPPIGLIDVLMSQVTTIVAAIESEDVRRDLTTKIAMNMSKDVQVKVMRRTMQARSQVIRPS